MGQLHEFVRDVRLKAAELPYEERFEYIKLRFASLSSSDQREAEDLFEMFAFGHSIGIDMGNDLRTRAHHKQIERYLAFGCATAFVVAMLILAILIPEPKPDQAGVFRTVLALAAAGFAMFIPGFLEVEVKPYVRAGGALAVFAVVYFLNPAQYVSEIRDPVAIVNPSGLR